MTIISYELVVKYFIKNSKIFQGSNHFGITKRSSETSIKISNTALNSEDEYKLRF